MTNTNLGGADRPATREDAQAAADAAAQAGLDDDELVFGDEATGAPGADIRNLPGTAIPKEDRRIPATAETIITLENGEQIVNEDAEPFFWGRAHHNLPGFLQPFVDGKPPRGLMVGEAGWIPNNEEGVSAVSIGFVEIESAPEGAVMPTVVKSQFTTLDL